MSSNKTYKDIFTLFDKKAQGTIPVTQLGDFLRAIGYNPTNSLVSDLIKKNFTNTNDISLNDIDNLITSNKAVLESTTNASVDDFIKAFQVFDKENTGKISIGDLKYMLTGLGERLNEDEVDELLKGVESTDDGMIEYRSFIDDILKR
ncbi:probable Myosin light chain 1 [Saccharomycodes ludwigii]|uniref:Probable Myosin light chain 1 n=1 Tax=Saccharomycodes ludwigii TaxID=36035 RepID=A0A376B5H5_9ASCO|nr:hypothetical protein SCDLUD_001026 [Saccharomycodes ludwigii]KAH3903392.1 hypothetical protein SCDLUD_001026 [Saccharomycodes ludwigii]SSD59872.1 probable Myosin light chain 1 [Saccharomycodes ludwigii]